MDKKVTGIVSYITIIGWVIAYLAGDKEAAKFHLNQSLVIELAGLINSFILGRILGFIPILGELISFVISILILILWILGIVAATKEEETPVPVIGQIKILK
ncbi:MAG: hypothetical protein J6A75_08040 [Lachnospiraceae bacterium]|nr:hypothetical protein [Lachnospiraceae bacterium]